MNEGIKRALVSILSVIFVVVFAVWMNSGDLEHIEDTNGSDNYRLTTITDQDIVEHSMGLLNLSQSTNNLNNTVKFSSDKFTGVKEIMWTDVIFTTDFSLDILDFEVNSGNFKMAVINEGKIVAELTPEDDFPVYLGQLKGNVSLVIAGESADFSFRLFESDYESYAHN